MNKLKEIMKIADIHADKITLALSRLNSSFPLNGRKILNITEQEMVYIELLINRFAKLQDYLGRILINKFLEAVKDYDDKMTTIDKINKLEKLQIIDNAELWHKMREVRNLVAHEYPDQPELMAKYINQIFDFTPELLKIFNKIKVRMGFKCD